MDSGYVTPVPSHITIYNIQNQQPVLVSVVNIPELAISTVNDGIIYGFGQASTIASTTVPVYTFDVRSGSVIQNQYNLPPPSGAAGVVGGFISITGGGNMIYASQPHPDGSAYGKALDAFDISTPSPTLVTWIPTGDNGFQVQAVGQLVFDDNGVYDFSTPTPTQVGDFAMISVRAVQGNQVLALGQHFNYLVIDVSNPATPTITANLEDVGSENPYSFPNGALAGSNFYSADALGGLAVFDISAPGGPVNEPPNPLYELDNAQFQQVFDQVVQSSTLYAAGVTDPYGDGGLITFDASGSQPTRSGSLLYSNEYGLAVQVSGTSAFLGLNDKLKVVDISNASSPTEVGSVTVPVNALALSGTTLFAGTGDSRLVVFNVSTPASPSQIAAVSIPAPPVTMRISGTLLFVADGPQGLLIFDISNVNAPTLLSQFTLSTPVWDVATSGTTAFLPADSSGLVIVDISNPAEVKQLSQTAMPVFNPFPSYTTTGSITLAVSVAIQNGLVYVGTGITDPDASDALAAFDFSQLTSPRLLSFRHQVLDTISVITPSGSNLFLADGTVISEFDNSFPRNSIELYAPPSLLAQSLPLTNQSQHPSYPQPKLNFHKARATRRSNPRTLGPPPCPVRYYCEQVRFLKRTELRAR